MLHLTFPALARESDRFTVPFPSLRLEMEGQESITITQRLFRLLHYSSWLAILEKGIRLA